MVLSQDITKAKAAKDTQLVIMIDGITFASESCAWKRAEKLSTKLQSTEVISGHHVSSLSYGLKDTRLRIKIKGLWFTSEPCTKKRAQKLARELYDVKKVASEYHVDNVKLDKPDEEDTE